MTDKQQNTVIYQMYKIMKLAPTKEKAMREVFDLLDEPTRKRELESGMEEE